MVWRGNVEERLRGGMVGVEKVDEWFKRRNGENGGAWGEVWSGGMVWDNEGSTPTHMMTKFAMF